MVKFKCDVVGGFEENGCVRSSENENNKNETINSSNIILFDIICIEFYSIIKFPIYLKFLFSQFNIC